MYEMLIGLGMLAWLGTGLLGAKLLSYPCDGLNFRHILGPIVGPAALLVAMLEWAFPD